MKQKSFWIQWLVTFVILMVIEIIFDMVMGELSEAFTASRIFWMLAMSLGINIIFFRRQLKNGEQKK